MTTKTEEKRTRKAKPLKIKDLAADKAKRVKGGPCPGTNTSTSSLRFS